MEAFGLIVCYQMLPNERGIWSDMSGTVELAPKEELPAPEGYHWIEDDWSLDQSGPWVDEILGIGKWTRHTQEQGL